MSTLKKKYRDVIRKGLIEKKLYNNVMQVPQLTKIVINRGLGESSTNSKAIEISVESLYAISGQKPITTKAISGKMVLILPRNKSRRNRHAKK